MTPTSGGRPVRRRAQLRHVAQHCRGATAGNLGPTVLAVERAGGGAMLVRLSSWPRAQQAKVALLQRGYAIEDSTDEPNTLVVRGLR